MGHKSIKGSSRGHLKICSVHMTDFSSTLGERGTVDSLSRCIQQISEERPAAKQIDGGNILLPRKTKRNLVHL